MTTPFGTLEVLEREVRRVRVRRRTRETEVTIVLDLDGTGVASVETGVERSSCPSSGGSAGPA